MNFFSDISFFQTLKNKNPISNFTKSYFGKSPLNAKKTAKQTLNYISQQNTMKKEK